jgi:hypothetical protein
MYFTNKCQFNIYENNFSVSRVICGDIWPKLRVRLCNFWLRMHQKIIFSVFGSLCKLAIFEKISVLEENARIIKKLNCLILYKHEVLGRTNRPLSLIRHRPYRKQRDHQSFTVACVFVAAVTFLPNRCLATLGEYTCRHTGWWKGFMKYAIEMGSGVMILSNVGVVFYGVWIGDCFYWPLIHTIPSYILQFTVAQALVFSVLYSLHWRCLVAVFSGGSSPSSGFPNSPRPQLPASHSNSSQWLNCISLTAH